MKAILVIDIPDNLKYEDLYLEGRILYRTKKDIVLKFLKELSMCSLKPMPQKKEVKGDFYKQREIATEMNDLIDFDKGYNTCIDEILGGE